MNRKREPANRCRKCKIVLSKEYPYTLCPEHKKEQDALDEEARIAEEARNHGR